MRLSLLLGENVLLIAKEAEAAANHSDQYAGYIALLGDNADDLVGVIRLAFGNTAAGDFATLWSAQDANYINYSIGVVTHNRATADAALVRLLNDSAPKLADLFAGLAHMSPGSLTKEFVAPVAPIQGFIDDGSALNYKRMYTDMQVAYIAATGLGDVLAPLIVNEFPDKFPGDVSTKAVTDRLLTNKLLQQRAYLVTMATDAMINGRSAEAQAASAALASNATAIGTSKDLWTLQVTDVAAYVAKDDDASKTALTRDFAARLAASAHVSASLVADQAAATVKVIDDQRTKSYDALPVDDRIAAAAMQPIADAIAAQT